MGLENFFGNISSTPGISCALDSQRKVYLGPINQKELENGDKLEPRGSKENRTFFKIIAISSTKTWS
jgi:hypothetical protein